MTKQTQQKQQSIGLIVWSCLIGITSGGGFFYLLTSISPFTIEGQLNLFSVGVFLVTLWLLLTSLGILLAHLLHRRWPKLAGAHLAHDPPKPNAAARQGVFFATAILVLAILALFQAMDIAFVVVTIAFFSLLEVFLQNRE